MKYFFCCLLLTLCFALLPVQSMAEDSTIIDFGRGVPRSLTWDADARHFFVLSQINVLWRYDSQQLAQTTAVDNVHGIRFSPQGDWIMTADADIKWTLRSTEDIQQVVLTNQASIRFSPDNRWIAAEDSDGTFALRRLDSPEQVRMDGLSEVDFDPTGDRILVRTADGFSLLESESLQLAETQPMLDTHLDVTRRWSQDGRYIAERKPRMGYIVWDLTAPETPVTIPVTQMDRYDHWGWIPDSQRLYDHDADWNTRTWDASTGNHLIDFPFIQPTYDEYNHLDTYWSPDGSFLLQCVYGGDSVRCTVLDSQTGDVVRDRLGGIYMLDMLSPDRQTYMWGDGLYDASTLEQTTVFDSWQLGDVTRWSPDSSLIAGVSLFRPMASIYDTQEAKIRFTPELGQDKFSNRGVVWSPDSKTLATWDQDGLIILWNTQTGEEIGRLTEHVAIRDYVFNDDQSRIAIADQLGTIYIWDTATGEQLHTLSGHQFELGELEWQPEGTLLASTTGESILSPDPPDGHQVRIWETTTGDLVDTIEHDGEVSSIAWHPQGDYLATVDYHEIFVWGAASGQRLITLAARQMASLSWSPDGAFLMERYMAGSHGLMGHDIWETGAFTNLASEIHTMLMDEYTWTPASDHLLHVKGRCDEADCYVRVTDLYDVTEPDPNDYRFGNFVSQPHLHWSPDRRHLLTADDRVLQVWQVDDTHAMLILSYPGIGGGQWDSTGQMLLFTTENGIRVVEVPSGRDIFQLTDAAQPSWRGETVVSMCRGEIPLDRACTVEEWDTAAGERIEGGLGLPGRRMYQGPFVTYNWDGRFLLLRRSEKP